jgi:SET domain-containing protein
MENKQDEKKQNVPLDIPKRCRLGYSELFGRGVFATEDIRPGDLIERCPIEILAFRKNYHKDPTIFSYMFTHSCPCQECKNHGAHFIMAMGFAQMYNHQDDNSAEIKFDLANKIADIHARKEIKNGEEIFLNYGPNYFKDRKKIVLGEDGKPLEAGDQEKIN